MTVLLACGSDDVLLSTEQLAHRLLGAGQQAACPLDRPGHGGLVLGHRGGLDVLLKDIGGCVNLAGKLLEDVVDLAHHLLLDSALGPRKKRMAGILSDS